MSLSEENKMVESAEILPDQEEESTIFSAPAEHRDLKPKKQHAVLKLIAAFLVLAIIIGSTVAVIKYIPEKQNTPQTQIPTISIISVDPANISSIDFSNKEGKFTVVSKITDSNGTSTTSWYIQDLAEAYVSSYMIESTVKSVTSINAFKTVEGTAADFGLDEPSGVMTVHPKNNAFAVFTVNIGNEAPGGLGYYCSISGKTEIYLADLAVSSLTSLKSLDFATTAGIQGVVQTSENANCFNEGSISDFDYIRLSGKNFPNPLQIEIQEDETINAYFPFIVTSPSICIANEEKVYELLELLSAATTSAGAYSYTTDEIDIKKFGLDDPDAQLTISVAGKAYTIIAKKVDDDYFAVVDSYGGLIHKVSPDSIQFALDTTTDYYNSRIILENLSGLSNFKVEFSSGKIYDFVTVFDPNDKTEGEGGTYFAYFGGKQLDITNFKALYSQFIEFSPISYDSKTITDTAMTIRLVHSDGTNDTVLKFKLYSNGRYQVEVNGIPGGLITAHEYNNFVTNVDKVANDIKITD